MSVPQPALVFDHIAIVARNLDEGATYIKDRLGIEMPPGGAHPAMGTHNRLLALGPDSYLEVIAIDPEAAPPQRPRWFDLDRFDAGPRLGTWVLGTPDLDATLAAALSACGRATPMARGDLTWQISIRDDGALPFDGAHPSFIEWPSGAHPAGRMVDLNCRLEELVIGHPRAQEIQSGLQTLSTQIAIGFEVKSKVSIRATVRTPSGIRYLD